MRNTQRYVLISIAVAVMVVLAVACGGGSDEKSPSGSSGSGATTSAASSVTPDGDGSGSNGDSELAEAGPELSAFKLLDAAGYAAGGVPVTVIEDDGVVPATFGCEQAQARVLTQGGVILTVGLHTAASTEDAAQVFQGFANFGSPTPIAGAGDESAYMPGEAVVRKGSQVLVVQGQPGLDLQSQLDQIKTGGGDPRPATEAAVAVAQTAASALATKLQGAACPETSALGVPAGVLPPCLTKAADIESALGISGVKVTPMISDSPPLMQCDYDLGEDGTISVYQGEAARLQSGIDPTTTPAVILTRRQSAAARQPANYQSLDNGEFKGVGSVSTNIGIDSWLLFQQGGADAASAAHPVVLNLTQTSPPASEIILRILQSTSSAKLIRPGDCNSLMQLFMRNALEGYQSERGDVSWTHDRYEEAQDALDDWCAKAVIQARSG